MTLKSKLHIAPSLLGAGLPLCFLTAQDLQDRRQSRLPALLATSMWEEELELGSPGTIPETSLEQIPKAGPPHSRRT